MTETGGSYVLPVYRGDVRHTVLVWNGIKDYQRTPTPENLVTVNMGGLAFGEKVSIAQIGKPVGRKGRSALKTLTLLMQSFDSVILWARDTKTYKSIRDELRMNATLRFDGTPITEAGDR
jgi:hypothetical protein